MYSKHLRVTCALVFVVHDYLRSFSRRHDLRSENDRDRDQFEQVSLRDSERRSCYILGFIHPYPGFTSKDFIRKGRARKKQKEQKAPPAHLTEFEAALVAACLSDSHGVQASSTPGLLVVSYLHDSGAQVHHRHRPTNSEKCELEAGVRWG